MPRSSLPRGLLAWLLLWAAFAAVHWTARHQPYWWDSLGYVFAHAVEIHDAHLFPILRRWDVGHPTAYFTLLAASMQVFGVGPLAGHVLGWGFAALLAWAVHALARASDLGRAAAAAVTAAALSFPLVWASTRQITADLALAALAFAALASWAGRRRRATFVFASLVALTKFTGFLIVPALLAASLPATPPARGSRRREALHALAPLIPLGLFLALRWVVRGPGWTIGWEPMQDLAPLWRWAAFHENWDAATRQLWGLARISRPAAALAAALALLALRRALQGRRFPPPPRAVVGVAAFGLVWAAAHLQMTALLPRFGTPLAVATFLLLGWTAGRLAERDGVVVAAAACFVLLNVAAWRPAWSEGLPPALHPAATDLGHELEIDLRYEDGIALIRWAAAEVRRDAGGPAGVAAQWPVTTALADPRRGYVAEAFPVRAVGRWEKAVDAAHPYVVAIEGLTRLPADPSPCPSPVRLVAARSLGGLTARVWRVEAGRPAP